MKQLFLLGDSISIFYGPALGDCLAGAYQVTRKGGAPDAAIGHVDEPAYNGQDSGAVLSFLKNSPPKCDLLLFNCGLHDIKIAQGQTSHQVTIGLYQENLQKIVTILKELSCCSVWVNSTPVIDSLHNSRKDGGAFRYNRDILQYNEAAAEIMGHAAIPVIDLYSFTLSLGPECYLDHVHFTPHTCRLQAQFLADIFGQNIC